MSLLDIVDKNSISVNLQSLEKNDVIEELVDLLVKSGKVKDRDMAINDVMSREEKGTTGLEKGIAIPHAKTAAVDNLSMAIGISKDGVDFKAADGGYSYIFFLLLAAPGISGPHIEALSEIARLVQISGTIEKLKEVKTPEEVLNIISQYENGR